MRVYFTNKSLHQKLIDVDDAIYTFLARFQCSAFKKHIYIADDGYYEIKEDVIYRNYLDFSQPPPTQLKTPDLLVTNTCWLRTETNVLASNSIKVDNIVERFKMSDTMTFVIERNDEATVDYFIDIKGKTIQEEAIISFLSEITNVCVN